MILTGENRTHCHHCADKLLPQLHEALRAFAHSSCRAQCLVSNFHQRGKSLDMPVDVGLLWNTATVRDNTIQTHCGRLSEICISECCKTQIGNNVCQRRFLVQYIWRLPSYCSIPGHRTGMEIKHSVHYIQHRVQNLIQNEHNKETKRTSSDITSWF
jgi:hypothetical protein